MIDQLERIEVKDGDILRLPAGTDLDLAAQIGKELRQLHPDKRFIVLCGDLDQISDENLKAAGWVRHDLP